MMTGIRGIASTWVLAAFNFAATEVRHSESLNQSQKSRDLTQKHHEERMTPDLDVELNLEATDSYVSTFFKPTVRNLSSSVPVKELKLELSVNGLEFDWDKRVLGPGEVWTPDHHAGDGSEVVKLLEGKIERIEDPKVQRYKTFEAIPVTLKWSFSPGHRGAEIIREQD